jgi:hypothetical protein
MTFPAHGKPTAVLVRTYRVSAAQLRRLNASGSTSTPTLRAIERHTDILRDVERTLCATGRREFAGTLTEERQLVDRLASAKRDGERRPELHNRLATLRRSLVA